MNTMHIPCAALTALFAVSVAHAATTADYYVQDGLVAHWDAIDNAGTGAHDASATTWKNLVDGGIDLTIRDAQWADGNSLYNNYAGEWSGAYLAAYSPYDADDTPVDYVTGEFAISNVNSLMSGDEYMMVFGYADQANSSKGCFLESNRAGFASGVGSIPGVGCDTLGWNTIAWDHDGNSAYLNGSAVSLGGNVSRSVWRDWTEGTVLKDCFVLGCHVGGKNSTFNGKYHAIRLYSRSLTADEAARNALLDRIRFVGEDGYRTSGAVIEKRFVVAASANATVAVDGATLSSDYEAWDELDTTVTRTVTVSPAAGYMFTGWSGDTDAIVTCTADLATITVAYGKAVSLTPVVVAIPEPAMATPIYTITVDSGVTTTLTTAEDDSGTAIGTMGTLVKKGGGKLVIDSDVISSFTGEIVISNGCWHTTVRTGLGTQDGGDVWVSGGATLSLYSGSDIASGDTAAQITRKVYIEGAGYDGRGALYGSVYTTDDTVYNLYPKNVELLGDTLIGSHNKANLDFSQIILNRHTLTISAYTCNWNYFSGTVENGSLAITNKPLYFLSSLYLPGGAENTVYFRDGGAFRYNGFGWGDDASAQGRWTAVFEDGAYFFAYGPNDRGAAWNGPVVLNGHTELVSQTRGGKTYLYGEVSGTGDLGGGDFITEDPWTFRDTYLCLANANNSFTGGVKLQRRVLEATVDGAVPANGAALVSEDSTINLSGETEYHLPDLTITGTGIVYSASAATGSFKTATKSGDYAYIWNTKVGAQSFALNGGLLAFGDNAASDGVIAADFGAFNAVPGATVDLGGYAWTCTNLTGSCTISNGTFTVDGPWTASATADPLECGEAGALAFGPDAVVTVSDLASLRSSQEYVLASSTATITSLPALDSAATEAHWNVIRADGGCTLKLKNTAGLTIFVR